MSLLPFLYRAAARENLNTGDARQAMTLILEGAASTAQIAAFLVALRMKGETAEELLGFARAMREKMRRVEPNLDGEMLLDTCGTGGDQSGTFNISTVAAFVIAGAGARVAKHGNRSISSQCGSAEVLEALGVNIGLTAEEMARAIREVGIAFLFAPALHPAMKHAQPARLELKMPTVFNLLGPLTNPAGARAQLIGAPSASTAELMATALEGLGVDRAFVVHGFNGLDEISTTGPTLVFEVRGDSVQKRVWTPADFGVPCASLEELRGGARERNREIAQAVLEGAKGAPRDIVLVNAAAALVAAGKAATLQLGMEIAARSIDSGAAARKVEQLARFSAGESEHRATST
ncbi:MAG: anthranilate phosphoribosyltransferase [Pseudomonadota bacterium]